VKSFLTSPVLEKAGDLNSIELETAKKDYANAYENYEFYKGLLASAHYYKHIDKFRDALDCSDLIEQYEDLDDLHTTLQRCHQSKSFIETGFLNEMYELFHCLSNVQKEEPVVSTVSMDSLTSLLVILEETQQEKCQIDLGRLIDLCEIQQTVDGITKVSAEINILTIAQLTELLQIITILADNEIRIEALSVAIEACSTVLTEFEYMCPIHGLVYIVGGECLSHAKVI